MVERGYGFGMVKAGPWTAWPKAGTDEADPYARAIQARSGEIPLGPAEGLTFLAATDSQGRALDRRCSYLMHAPVPQARYWTLTVIGKDGMVIGGPEARHGFTSGEIVRNAANQFSIAISPQVRPGNWLPVSGDGDLVLMLRLYDTALTSTANALGAADMPRIEQTGCP